MASARAATGGPKWEPYRVAGSNPAGHVLRARSSAGRAGRFLRWHAHRSSQVWLDPARAGARGLSPLKRQWDASPTYPSTKHVRAASRPQRSGGPEFEGYLEREGAGSTPVDALRHWSSEVSVTHTPSGGPTPARRTECADLNSDDCNRRRAGRRGLSGSGGFDSRTAMLLP